MVKCPRLYCCCLLLFMVLFSAYCQEGINSGDQDESLQDGQDQLTSIEEQVAEATLGFGHTLPLLIPNKSLYSIRQALAVEEYWPSPGDSFAIHIVTLDRGEYKFTQTLQKDYTMQIPFLGRYDARDKTYLKIRSEIIDELAMIIAPRYSDVSLFAPAAYEVFVDGAVLQPGVIYANSFLRLGEAIASAGGLTENAGYRRITIRNSEGSRHIVDLSKFSKTGEERFNPYLKRGDIITIPFSEKPVTIEGPVRNPGRYDLLPEENLVDLLTHAGGFSVGADTEYLRVERYLNSERYTRIRADLEAEGDYRLIPGDRVTVLQASLNAPVVTFEGPVFGQPIPESGEVVVPEAPIAATFSHYPGMTLRELLEDLGGPTVYADPNGGIILNSLDGRKRYFRIFDVWSEKDEDIELYPWDNVIVSTHFVNVSVDGEVMTPEIFRLYPGQTLADLITLANGFRPGADRSKIRLMRKGVDGKSTQLRINYHEQAEFELVDGDEVIVFSGSQNTPLIVIEGAVFGQIKSEPSQPLFNEESEKDNSLPVHSDIFITTNTVLPFFEGMTLRAALDDVGGPTPYADPEGGIILNSLNNSKRYFNVFAVWDGVAPDLDLEPWDFVLVASRVVNVSIDGQVAKPGLYRLFPGQSIGDLIIRADGFRPNADIERIHLTRRREDGTYTVVTVGPSDMDTALIDGDFLEVLSATMNAPFVTVEGALFGMVQTRIDPVFLPLGEISQPFASVGGVIEKVPVPISVRLPHFEGLSMAYVLESLGGPTPFAIGEKCVVYRDEQEIGFDVFALWNDRVSAARFILKPGDHVVVPMEQQIVAIVGEVNAPRILPFQRGTSLREYIFPCGGITEEGDENSVWLLDELGRPTRLINFNYQVEPGDVVFVDKGVGTKFLEGLNTVIPLVSTIVGVVAAVINLISTLGNFNGS